MTKLITTNNRTRFETCDIVRLLRGSLRATKTGRDTRYVTIDVGYTRHSSSSAGACWTVTGIGKRDLLLRLRLRNEDHTAADVHALAGRIMQALDTSPGKESMIPFWQRDTRWADDCSLKLKVVVTKTPQERSADREAHARRMLARAQADVQRAQARVDKWLPKVRYYDRKKEA